MFLLICNLFKVQSFFGTNNFPRDIYINNIPYNFAHIELYATIGYNELQKLIVVVSRNIFRFQTLIDILMLKCRKKSFKLVGVDGLFFVSGKERNSYHLIYLYVLEFFLSCRVNRCWENFILVDCKLLLMILISFFVIEFFCDKENDEKRPTIYI